MPGVWQRTSCDGLNVGKAESDQSCQNVNGDGLSTSPRGDLAVDVHGHLDRAMTQDGLELVHVPAFAQVMIRERMAHDMIVPVLWKRMQALDLDDELSVLILGPHLVFQLVKTYSQWRGWAFRNAASCSDIRTKRSSPLLVLRKWIMPVLKSTCSHFSHNTSDIRVPVRHICNVPCSDFSNVVATAPSAPQNKYPYLDNKNKC